MLAYFLACAPVPSDEGAAVLPPPVEDTSTEVEPPLPDSGPRDTGSAEDVDPIVTEEDAPPFEDTDLTAWLFSLDRIHEVALTIPTDSVNALGAAPYEWASADISIDGEALPDVGVRLRGKIGSFRSLSGKPKFKVSFGEYVDDQTFYGLKELSLNNSIVDCSYMKEVIGHRIYQLAGMPYLRTAYAHVTVNGADYGLYVLVETPNDVWLERHYADPDGNLYDGKYVWYGGWNYTLLDFGDGVDALYQLEEGDDMGELVDWDEIHRNIAVDQFVGHVDGYSMNTNNYRVYFDPSDGKMDMLAWDLDYAFYRDVDWGMSWQNANGNLTNACLANAECRSAQRAAVRRLVAVYEAEDMEAWYDGLESLTYAATQADPRRECGAGDVQTYRNYIRDWLRAEPAYLRGWWGL